MVVAAAIPMVISRMEMTRLMRSLLLLICLRLLARFCSSTSEVTLFWSFLLILVRDSR